MEHYVAENQSSLQNLPAGNKKMVGSWKTPAAVIPNSEFQVASNLNVKQILTIWGQSDLCNLEWESQITMGNE